MIIVLINILFIHKNILYYFEIKVGLLIFYLFLVHVLFLINAYVFETIFIY